MHGIFSEERAFSKLFSISILQWCMPNKISGEGRSVQCAIGITQSLDLLPCCGTMWVKNPDSSVERTETFNTFVCGFPKCGLPTCDQSVSRFACQKDLSSGSPVLCFVAAVDRNMQQLPLCLFLPLYCGNVRDGILSTAQAH